MNYDVTEEINNLPPHTSRGGLTGVECKFVMHIPADPVLNRQDVHYVKEVFHYKDGSSIRNFRPVVNFKRRFWVTKEHKQNHKQKKETELLSNVNEYTTTQSDLVKNVAARLGPRFTGCKQFRDISVSPYIYGLDVTGADEIKYLYSKKYPDQQPTSNVVSGFDIETNPETDEVILISVAIEGAITTCILQKFLPFDNIKNIDVTLERMFRDLIPDEKIAKETKVKYIICKTEVDVIKESLLQAHTWQPDFLSIWNMDFDISKIVAALERHGEKPEDYFSDPRLKEEYKYFYYKKPSVSKMSASGVNKSPKPQENWPIVKTPASFYIIDGMCTYNYVRSGQKQVPGGYGLDNILKHNLGDKLKKLKFQDEESEQFVGVDWHIYMQTYKPLQYVIYNQWDVLSMLALDNVTEDLKTQITLLSGLASYEVFKSGPQKLVTDLHFFGLDHGVVSGVADKINKLDRSEFLGNDNWIVMLPVDRTIGMGMNNVEGAPNIHTHMCKAVGDIDQTSGYPSDGQACNVSKDTTVREIISIGDIPKNDFKLNNINFMYGKVNHPTYMMKMCNFPSFRKLERKIKEMRDAKKD